MEGACWTQQQNADPHGAHGSDNCSPKCELELWRLFVVVNIRVTPTSSACKTDPPHGRRMASHVLSMASHALSMPPFVVDAGTGGRPPCIPWGFPAIHQRRVRSNRCFPVVCRPWCGPHGTSMFDCEEGFQRANRWCSSSHLRAGSKLTSRAHGWINFLLPTSAKRLASWKRT